MTARTSALFARRVECYALAALDDDTPISVGACAFDAGELFERSLDRLGVCSAEEADRVVAVLRAAGVL
jgi:hypothetical protein